MDGWIQFDGLMDGLKMVFATLKATPSMAKCSSRCCTLLLLGLYPRCNGLALLPRQPPAVSVSRVAARAPKRQALRTLLSGRGWHSRQEPGNSQDRGSSREQEETTELQHRTRRKHVTRAAGTLEDSISIHGTASAAGYAWWNTLRLVKAISEKGICGLGAEGFQPQGLEP
jgi:hypothetical protein